MIPHEQYEQMQTTAAFYALGTLTLVEAQAFESQLTEYGTSMTDELTAFESIVAELGLCAPEHSPSASLRGKLLAQVADEVEVERSPVFFSPQFLNLRRNEGDWREVSPGLKVKQLYADTTSGTVTTLLKLDAGASIPPHFHHGPEQCYILEGDFYANEDHLGPGDFHVALPGSTHQKVATRAGALVLIVAPERYEALA